MFYNREEKMIIVPAWIKEDVPDGIRAILGSEPAEGAEAEWIPRDSMKNCLYAPVEFEGRKMAMLVFEDDKAPESVLAIIGKKK
jgi:hypothetical protein